VHPTQALAEYRRRVQPTARLATLAMTATESTIADPTDPGQLDMVGMDLAAPHLLADFARGDL
jgi:60 kDa SS-A/Ro ribonucleoprotein